MWHILKGTLAKKFNGELLQKKSEIEQILYNCEIMQLCAILADFELWGA